MTILNGWKEISNYLGRGVRTVQRWESLGLPVRRPKGSDRSAVIAVAEEIDAWVQKCASHNPPQNGGVHPLATELIARAERTRELLHHLRQRRDKMQSATLALLGNLQQILAECAAKRAVVTPPPHRDNNAAG